MSILDGLRSHHRIFGPHGVFLVAKCRLTNKPMEIHVRADGIAHPVKLRMRTTDASVFEAIILEEEYFIDIADSPPSVVVDAGANIGLTAVYFANKFPHARIFAIEPEAMNFRMLQENAAPYPNITPIRAALWNDTIALELDNPGKGDWAFQTREHPSGQPTGTSVPGMTIDGLMSKYDLAFVDLLKVDIEGAEKEVFEKSERWIDKIGAIVVELHDRMKPGCSESVLGAAKDFPITWQKGETTFMFRDNASGIRAARAGRMASGQKSRPKILRVEL